MIGKIELTKIKLFLYMVGSQGRLIYETLTFEHESNERSHEKKSWKLSRTIVVLRKARQLNGTSFLRAGYKKKVGQRTSLSLDVKILDATCNIGGLKDWLICDRIICGLKDSKLRQDLLKIADLNLDKCLQVCKASELSKEMNRTIEKSEDIHLKISISTTPMSMFVRI